LSQHLGKIDPDRILQSEVDLAGPNKTVQALVSQVTDAEAQTASFEQQYGPIREVRFKYNPDGSVMLVIADKDPGVGNFIYTDHHLSGTMLLRWVSATSDPQPRCRVVKLAELEAGKA